MNELFSIYENAFNNYLKLIQERLPRTLYLFNIRLRIALDMEIKFNGEMEITKSLEAQEAYIKVIKLLERWNTYEALNHYMKELSGYVKKKESIYTLVNISVLNDSDAMQVLKCGTEKISKNCVDQNEFREDIDKYFKKISDDTNLSNTLRISCERLHQYILDGKSISSYEMLGLIYAERNMYYHNGETARMGMKYCNRIKLLDIFIECIEDYMLKLVTYILNKEIGHITTASTL